MNQATTILSDIVVCEFRVTCILIWYELFNEKMACNVCSISSFVEWGLLLIYICLFQSFSQQPTNPAFKGTETIQSGITASGIFKLIELE